MRNASLVLLLTSILYLPIYGNAGELYFVAHKSVSLSKLSSGELRDIYLKKTRFWPDGQKIRPVDRNVGSVERADFLNSILQLSNVQCVEYWIQQKQETGAVQPLQVESEQVLLHLVETMPGSIGYLRDEKNRAQILHYKNIKVLQSEK